MSRPTESTYDVIVVPCFPSISEVWPRLLEAHRG
jgi:hypothetical protein